MKAIVTGLVVSLVMGAAMPAMAQTAGQCAAVGNDTERLACYDAVFRPNPATADETRFSLNSEQLIPAYPNGRAPATITVACRAGALEVAFGFAGNTISSLGRDAGITLQYDLQRRSRTLPVNADNTALLISGTADTLSFIESLAGTTNLTVRVTPASTRTLSVRFPVSGIADQVEPVVAACAR